MRVNHIASGILLLCVITCSLAVPLPAYAGYGQGDYYAQAYYQSTYYSQGTYYQQGSYYSGGITAGTQIYSTPGTYQFTVPTGVNAIRAFVIGGGGGGGGLDWGGGGGGGCGGGINGQAISVTPGQIFSITVGAGGIGGVNGGAGAAGGASVFNTVTASGGSYGGSGYYGYPNSRGPNGGSGGGSGGGGGGNPYPGFYAYPGSGGIAGGQTSSAGSGGMCTGSGWSVSPSTYIKNLSYTVGSGGYEPAGVYAYCGGGGGGGVSINGSTVGGDTGYAPTSGTYGPTCLPNGGNGYGAGGGGAYGQHGPAGGGTGAPGAVYIEWSPAPTCSVTFDSNPAFYGTGTTLRWTSEYAGNGFTINNAGPVTPNTSGSFPVSPGITTNYTGTVWNPVGVSATCPATLTVSAPTAPTATITSSRGATMNIGQSSTITATFSSASGDPVTHDNIDGAAGNATGWIGGLGADTNPTTPKSITFTPSTAGTYTFSARAQTSYYSSWTTYNSVTVTVSAPCTLGATTLQSGDSATFYSSQVAPSGQLCSAVSQSRTCTNGVLSGSASYQYASCTCAPLYSCSGSNITYTNSSCSVSTTATCVSPNYCSPGITTCVSPIPVFNAGTGTTGHLQVKPQIVPKNGTAKVLWNVSNVTGCSVVGTNGQTWNTINGSNTTLPITQQTTFTLACTPYSGQTFTSETQAVNVVPTFQEQ
jgi:hypothetical protein